MKIKTIFLTSHCLGIRIRLGGEILNNHESHYVCSRDCHTFYQDECKNNYIGLCRKIELHYLVDTEYKETTTANLVNDKNGSTL